MATVVAPLPVTSRVLDHMTDTRQQSVATDLPKLQPVAPARKPKLSLQTTSLTAGYGALSRGIVPNTAQATYTPTTTNTLTNQWDLSIRPSPISRTESPRPGLPKQQLPYTLILPFGVRSILKNSPLPRQASVSASPRDSKRKVFFPQPKKVTFRSNLEDAIETKEYVARNADLSSSDEDSFSEDTPSSSQTNSDDELTEYPSPPPSRKRKMRRETFTPTENRPQDQNPDTQSETHKDGALSKSLHSCKRRKWQWTLPTPVQLPSESKSESASKCESSMRSDASNSETQHDQTPHTDPDKHQDQDGESSHLDSCKACSDPDPDPDSRDLGSPPNVSKCESAGMDSKVTSQDYGHSEDKNS